MKSQYTETIKVDLSNKLKSLEQHFSSDVVFIYGPIIPAVVKFLRDFIEELKKDKNSKNNQTIFLNTPGGIVETVEKMVDIIRYHYKEISFVVPDSAYSAGTIFCMSGDKIYMDYSSALGPIDPQVWNGTEYVPALGYLDQVEKLIEKSNNDKLSKAEFAILQNQDLAMLSSYEQARNLTVTLLKEWLVKYKFKNWKTHSSTGKKVTTKERLERAEDVAQKLGDNKLWHSHGRMIGIDKLTNTLKLKVEDYSKQLQLRELIRSYNDLIIEYINVNNHKFFFHSRIYFWG